MAVVVAVVVVVCVPAGLPEPGLVTMDGGLMEFVLGVRDTGLAMRECDEPLLAFDEASPNRLEEFCRGEEFKEEVEFVRMEEREGRAICECKSELSFLSVLIRGRLVRVDRKVDISLG